MFQTIIATQKGIIKMICQIRILITKYQIPKYLNCINLLKQNFQNKTTFRLLCQSINPAGSVVTGPRYMDHVSILLRLGQFKDKIETGRQTVL